MKNSEVSELHSLLISLTLSLGKSFIFVRASQSLERIGPIFIEFLEIMNGLKQYNIPCSRNHHKYSVLVIFMNREAKTFCFGGYVLLKDLYKNSGLICHLKLQ